MSVQLSEIPSEAEILEAIADKREHSRKWFAAQTDRTVLALKAGRAAAAALSKARRNGNVSIAERMATMFFLEGKTLSEIGAAFGWTDRNTRSRAASLGIPLTSRAGYRRAPAVWVSEETFSSLSRVAHDMEASLPETIEKALMFLAEHGGVNARKLLRAPARSASATEGAAAA